MAQKQTLHPALLQQLQAFNVEQPQELQDYIAAQQAPKPKLEAVPDAPATDSAAQEETKPTEAETPPSDQLAN